MRLTYWTTACLEPDIEAVSKEVFDLADSFGGSQVFSVSPHLRAKVQQGGRVLGFNPILDPLLRLIIPAIERRSRINHVYSEASPWIYHRTLRHRPTILTIASEKGSLIPDFLTRCQYVVVQTEGMHRKLADLGLPAHKLRLIYPGVDLSTFRPAEAEKPARRPSILFATFPRSQEELQPRGVIFLIEMAKAFPEIDFKFVSRPWSGGSTALEAVRARLHECRISNVDVLEGFQRDMGALYAEVDFTVIPYEVADGGKECPRSLVESLASGVPVLISNAAPFSSFIEKNRCGAVFALNASSFKAAIRDASSRYGLLTRESASAARSHFDLKSTLAAYAEIYDSMIAGGA